MFFALSKIAYFLILPFTWIFALLLYSFITRRPWRKRVSFQAAIILVILFSNPLISNTVMGLWEIDPVPYDHLKNVKYDYAIVLSGIANPVQKPQDRIHLQKGADRIIHAIELYKQGIVKKMIITGGSGSVLFPELKESGKLADLAKMAGVPPTDIILEDQARNTAENAIYTAKLIDNKDKLLLVTSAFHMRRASACFKKTGLEVDVFATDLYASPLTYAPDDWLFPSVGAIHIWHILVKEWAGMIAYKIKGYI